MRVIFLDVDGVLVNLKSFQNKSAPGPATAWPDCVIELNRVVRLTGAHIVLSSAWRFKRYEKVLARTGVQKLLRRFGVRAKALGSTPSLLDDLGMRQPRGQEIQSWLTANPGVQRFVILDDDADMVHLSEYLIQTKFAEGLTAEHADEAIRRLA